MRNQIPPPAPQMRQSHSILKDKLLASRSWGSYVLVERHPAHCGPTKFGHAIGVEIFVDGERPYITQASTVEIARMGVVCSHLQWW